MTGTCLKCGCTEAHACADACEWVDERMDFCSTCGRQLLSGLAEPADLAEAFLIMRVLRSALLSMGQELHEQRQLSLHLAANQGMIDAGAQPAHSEIWTPGDDL